MARETGIPQLEVFRETDSEDYWRAVGLLLDLAQAYDRLDEAGRRRLLAMIRRIITETEGQAGQPTAGA